MAVIVKEILQPDLFIRDLVILDEDIYDFIHKEIIKKVGKCFRKISRGLVLGTVKAFRGKLKYKGRGKTISLRPFIYEVDGLSGYTLVILDLPVEGMNGYREIFIRHIMERISLRECEDIFVKDGSLFIRVSLNMPIEEKGRRNGQKVFTRKTS